jgi:hypothetical protein
MKETGIGEEREREREREKEKENGADVKETTEEASQVTVCGDRDRLTLHDGQALLKELERGMICHLDPVSQLRPPVGILECLCLQNRIAHDALRRSLRAQIVDQCPPLRIRSQ